MEKVLCQKSGKEGNRLNYSPYPGMVGKKIQESISEETWSLWLVQQTMLINENRLNPMDKDARKFLEEKMIEFLKLDLK